MRLIITAAITLNAGCHKCGGGYFEQVTGNKWKDCGSENRLSSNMSGNGQPYCSAGKNDNAACCRTDPCADGSTANETPKNRRECRGQWIGQEISSCGPE